ncbi:chloride channel protein [bacterium]|nr:chloride channel protein [bacterium]
MRDFRSREHLYLLVLAVFIGVLGGLGNLFFQFLIDLIRKMAWGGPDAFVQRFSEASIWLKLGVPTLGGLVGGMVIYFVAPEAKGHGVPEVMKATALNDGVIPKRTVIGKTVASALTLATGGSVGREGPIVQIGAAMGSAMGQMLKLNSIRMKTVVACGATAGIAATFNAPIAGAFFSAEVILGNFSVGYFAPLVISAVIATLVSHAYIGNDPAFIIPEGLTLTDGREILLYVFLGLLAAFVGQAFMRTLHKAEDIAESFPAWPPLKTALGGLMIGIVGIWAPRTLGNGYEAIEAAMNGEVLLGTLAVLLIVKIVATSITLGSGNSGGIFAPSLFMGVMMGGLLGRYFNIWFPDWTAGSGAYALVGMGAVVAAVIHAPITAIIMIFEMTRDYGIILPLMISVVVATLTSQKLERHSIYTFKLARQGIDLLKGKDHNVLRRLRVREVFRDHVEKIPQDMPLAKVLPLLAEASHHEAFVVNEQEHIVGILTLDEVKRALPQLDALGMVLIALDVATTNFPTVTLDDDLDFAMRQFGKSNIEEMPVVDAEDPTRPLGTLVRHDVIQAYNRAMLSEDLAGGVSSRMQSSVKSHVSETLGGFVLSECVVPHEMEGKSLRELDFRSRFHTQVLLVCSAEGDETCYEFPERETVLRAGDRILLFGTEDNVAKVKNL